MTLLERYKVLSLMPVNHMQVAQMPCGCCLHPMLQIDVIGNRQTISRVSDIRKLRLCGTHKTEKKTEAQ